MGAHLMARRGVFSKTLAAGMQQPSPQDSEAGEGNAHEAEGAQASHRASPNLKYFERSFQEQLQRSIVDVSTDLIDGSKFRDRLDAESDIEGLKDSILESGQQVPVLLRRTRAERYEVVYGRRRIAACRAIGRDVRAMVMELSDEMALIAQGVENAERLENSYIERALFVAQIYDAGVTVDIIQRTTGVGAPMQSRMRSAIKALPIEVIERIGPAHGCGRRVWHSLVDVLQMEGAPGTSQILKMIDLDLESSERLQKLLVDLKKLAKKTQLSNENATKVLGNGIAVKRTGRSLTFKAPANVDPQFLDHLNESIDQLYEAWSARRDQD
ncbi:plasmid partitioning protein RepB [Sagittula sp. SSi028]|uniref:plasmid partitioning protein RepB n=1 Tax=Sagittula sp. SSi028 TaxID=3400636 RepID=UPI003AF4645A